VRRVILVLVVILGLGLVPRPALAEPPKAFTEQLKKGRALEANGKHVEAAAALEAALRAVPDDPAALAELGWVQYKQRDLKKAEASTRAALAALLKGSAPDEDNAPFVTPSRIARGEVLYNLGRILEDGSDKPGAIKAYHDAHVAYPRGIVRDQLARLDAAAAAELEPYRPEKMQGPFASIDAFCKSAEKASTGDCECGHALKSEAKRTLAAPFEQVAVFPRRHCGDGSDQELDLAVKVAAGWYVTDTAPSETNSSPDHCGEAEWRFKGATMARSTLRLEYTTKANCNHKANDWGWDERATIAIGVGPSGTPSATPPIISTWDSLPERSHTIKVKLTWSDGAVEVAGKFAHKPDAQNLAGKHPLVFP